MILINGENLQIAEVVSVSRQLERVKLAEDAIPKIKASRHYVDQILEENRIVYGITTGVGDLANTLISKEDAQVLQLNLIRSHAVGVGEPLSEDIARGVILLRANALAKGFSGVRVELIQLLLDMLNKKMYPYIPSQGSVGSSGDLAPLSHLTLVLIGEGECLVNGQRVPSLEAFKQAGLHPLALLPKEGLAMINGTQIMASLACHILQDAEIVLKNAQIIGAMSLEALKGTAKAFDEKIHALRPHKGQIRCAQNMCKLVQDSQIMSAHSECEKVQDAYTLRCIPQVYGSVMDTIDYGRNIIAVEINSATDNPLIFAAEQEVISGGNFHGEPLAFAMDFLGIALSEIANISERTVDRLVNPHVSGLPPFLAANSGLNSGFMIAQYTAASLVSENKVLAHPASVDSIPTSAGQEDHVSMGTIAAQHAWRILKNVEQVLAIELLCAAQGMDFWDEEPGVGTRAAHLKIRQHISHLDADRILYKDIETARKLLIYGDLIKVVEEAVGPLA